MRNPNLANVVDALVVAKGVIGYNNGAVEITGTWDTVVGWTAEAVVEIGATVVGAEVGKIVKTFVIAPSRAVDEWHTGSLLSDVQTWVATITPDTFTWVTPVYAGQEPFASFTATPLTLLEGATVQFTNTSINDDDADYAWDFDGGALASTDENPLIQFDVAGDYDVTLTVTTDYGVSVSAAVTITVSAA